MKTTIKILFVSLIISLFSTLTCKAQVVSGVKPSPNGKMGEFTEWTKVDVSFDDGTKAQIEYRIALVKRKGIACHYTCEIKNNSEIKLNVRIKSSYYDKLVKGNYGEEVKDKLKPGKILAGLLVAQGCKKEKDVEKDDYGHCMACEFGVSIYVSKD